MPSPHPAPHGLFIAGKHQIYELAIQALRNQLINGSSYDQACDTLTELDQEMRDFVRKDFLEILIAEEHFGAGVDISDIALLLGLPYEQIEASVVSLLHNMVRETEAHRQGMSEPLRAN